MPKNWVEEALELSLWVPNHKLTFPWVFQILNSHQQKAVVSLALQLKAIHGPLTDLQKQAVEQTWQNPTYLVALGIRKSDNPVQTKEDFATLSCSVQVASLHLWLRGVGTKWSTSAVARDPRFYEIIGLTPETVQLEGILMVGWADHTPAPKPRPPLTEVLQPIPEGFRAPIQS